MANNLPNSLAALILRLRHFSPEQPRKIPRGKWHRKQMIEDALTQMS